MSLGVTNEVQTDKGVEFKYEVYCKREPEPSAVGGGDR